MELEITEPQDIFLRFEDRGDLSSVARVEIRKTTNVLGLLFNKPTESGMLA